MGDPIAAEQGARVKKGGCYKDKCGEPVIGLAVLIPASAGKDAFTVEVCENHAAQRERRGVEIIRNVTRRSATDGNRK